jgi:hypothetical protein
MIDEPECDGCRSQGVELKEYRKAGFPRSDEMKPLCELCAGTRVGQINDYPHLRENSDLVEIQRQINYVANEILKELRKR